MKRFLLIFLLCILLFVLLTDAVGSRERSHEKQLLEDALRRSATACYACEGFYPPDVDYLRAHYGFLYDESRYRIHYQFTASNLMPDIAVMEIQP